MKLYFIRHGESENNVKKCWTGWHNPNLTEKGVLEAEVVGKYLSKVNFDKIYTSDLMRSVQTVGAALPGEKHLIRKNLREINTGALSGMNFADGMKKYGQSLEVNIANVDYTDYGGESLKQLDERLSKFIEEINETVKEDNCENIAVFTHVGIIRRLCKLMIDLSVPAEKIICSNCAVVIFEYTGTDWKLNSWINLN